MTRGYNRFSSRSTQCQREYSRGGTEDSQPKSLRLGVSFLSLNDVQMRRLNDYCCKWLITVGMIGWIIPGCSEPKFYPARGKIIVFGVGPLKEGEIRFRPKARPSLVASGPIQKDGTFSVST